ncbi:methyltransferase, FkbM family [Mariprofundus aestuarium]|uniref:Methyltransferase, FkbM family n=1 Tax=Mariprofundus aestuarium TaxID=1921086 RepID=A0A2K8L310_MARES|nr:FkbM family methyltransferase [Mariprofundus aestuarium]ATX78636.1 methyltransferase, FkbM family [Mariprofundus aestuarium]
MSETNYSDAQVEALVKALRARSAVMESHFVSGVAIYGAGFLGEWAARFLIEAGANVTCFIDRDPAKAGTHIHGIPVRLPDDCSLQEQQAIFIAARHVIRDVETLIDMQNPDACHISFDGYFVIRNYERLCAVRSRFLGWDARSLETFNALLISMLTGSIESCLRVMEKDMYFGLPEFSGNFDEIFVDAGAFAGDSVERFIWENLGTFRHIYAFEPGDRQYRAMTKRMQRLADEWAFDPASVSLERAGLAAENGSMACTFTADAPLRHGLTAEVERGEQQSVPVYSLDAYLDGRPVSFIKADVEGWEVDLLKGAEQTIRRCKPKMALCAYHYPSDLFEIAEMVHAMVPEYRFQLRQHAPLFGDFVLYCYTK